MFQINTLVKGSLMTGLLPSIALLAACGPTPTSIPGNPTETTLTAIAVSEITSDNDLNSNISLSWGSLPGEVKSIKFFRRRADQAQDESLEIAKFDDFSQTTLKDQDDSLSAGVKYVYSIRGDDSNNIAVVSAESSEISIINAEAIKPFALTKPLAEGETLKDPLGKGHEFSWEDAGTGLYHVQVSNSAGIVLWGAITTGTKISYGTTSGKTVTGMDPKLALPLALSKTLTISSPSPNTARNEVKFQGIGGTGQYRIQVSAIETLPNKADLMSAKSIAIRNAKEIRFIAQ